jgi:hypothetical protein
MFPGPGGVERPTKTAMVEVAPIDPAHPDAQHCLRAYVAKLNSRFETGLDVEVAPFNGEPYAHLWFEKRLG